MLLYAATGDESSVDLDDTFMPEDDAIQCYTERFNSGEYLAFFRSPFNSKNNLTYLHNTYSRKLEKYFNFGRQIVAVNMIGTPFQDRNNGLELQRILAQFKGNLVLKIIGENWKAKYMYLQGVYKI